MKAILSLVFVLFTLSLFSQETINQFDANGKKHGKWIVWLDKDWHLAKDSMSAVYFRYNYFINGRSMYPMGPMGGKFEANPNSKVKKGNALLLDGEYKWFYKNGNVRFVNVLKDGWYISYKEYRSDGTLESFFDYTEHDRGQQYSWSMSIYDKKGHLKSKGWAYEEYSGKGVDN
jgi:hypothetical protein